MKKMFRNLAIIVIVAGVIFGIVKLSKPKATKAQTMQELINDMTLTNMQSNIKDQLAVHKKYILQLRGMNSEIKTIGSKLERKIELAKGFGAIGDQYIKDEFLPMALANYSMGLEVFPQDPVLNYKKGLILANYGSYYPDKRQSYYSEAEKYYRLALNISKDYSDPHYSLSLLYLVASEQKISIGSLQAALSEINTYLDITPSKNNSDAYFLKARIAYTLGDTNLALQSYQAILNLSSIGSEAYNKAKNNIMQLSGSI